MNRRRCVFSKKGYITVEKGGVHLFMWKITVTTEYYLSFSWMARSKQTCLSSCNIKYIFNSNIDIFSQINIAFIPFSNLLLVPRPYFNIFIWLIVILVHLFQCTTYLQKQYSFFNFLPLFLLQPRLYRTKFFSFRCALGCTENL